MPTATQPSIASRQSSGTLPLDCLYRLSVDQYHEMTRVGILTENDPIELLEGLLVKKEVCGPEPTFDDIWRLSVQQYHDMIQPDILMENNDVELLDGWLVKKMGKNPPHGVVTDLTKDALKEALPPGWHVRSQDPITTETSEPEPDIGVIRGKIREYFDRHPEPTDVGMLVEVSESSLGYDRGIKKSVYAAALIGIYWIINLIDNQIEVYTDPSGPSDSPDYGRCQIFGLSDSVPVILDGREVGRIPVRELLPDRTSK